MAALLSSRQMASFAARGFLRFDKLIPEELNQAFLEAAKDKRIPQVAPGVSLGEAYPSDSTLGRIMALPEVDGIVRSLVGPNPTFDHHFLHVAMPPSFFQAKELPHRSQLTHQDSTIDPRFEHFDIQLMYYPHKVTNAMGGTRFVPGTHLRKVSESATGRYQNIAGQTHLVCEAGTLLAMHHGIWHGGGHNQTDSKRYMFKLRLAPRVKQTRLWDTSDLGSEDNAQKALFWAPDRDPETIAAILCKPEPWFEADTGRLEYLNRIRFWRSLLGDANFDAYYWLSRIENTPVE